jgi:hypothetical protein
MPRHAVRRAIEAAPSQAVKEVLIQEHAAYDEVCVVIQLHGRRTAICSTAIHMLDPQGVCDTVLVTLLRQFKLG